MRPVLDLFSFFFFNDTATTEIYTLSLHDALPISEPNLRIKQAEVVDLWLEDRSAGVPPASGPVSGELPDRKSTRLNSSHGYISYAVFCLKKKKKQYKLYNVCHLRANLVVIRIKCG